MSGQPRVIAFCRTCRTREIDVTEVCDDPACTDHTCLDCGMVDMVQSATAAQPT